MNVAIQQGFEYQGEDWWKWWIQLDGPDKDLDEVDHVVYTLHHTFPNPVQKVNDRSSKFRLDAAGWGVFTIYANVVKKDGSSVKLSHHLALEYPDGRPTTA